MATKPIETRTTGNPILDYIAQGNSLASAEGRQLIVDASMEHVMGAIKDDEVAREISELLRLPITNTDVDLRRKLNVALGVDE